MILSVGYAAMLEQIEPGAAVGFAALSEASGFDGVMATDHYQPWVPQQGQSSFLWAVLGALGSRTSGAIGGVTTPGYRVHPAIVAQASATMASLYPGRHWLGIGSGEAVNEHVVGGYWPEAPERIARMFEAIEVIRKLFGSQARDVRHSGRYFTLESTRLWTLPAAPPPILVATAGPTTARRAGRLVDGLITVERPRERLEQLLQRFDEGARDAGRDPTQMPKVLQLHVSWAETEQAAVSNALTQWPNGALGIPTGDIRSPFTFAQLARHVGPEDFEGRVLISSDPDVHRAHLQRFADLGFTRIYVHNVGRNQDDFIKMYALHVIGKVTV